MPIKAGNTTKINEDIKDIKSAIDGYLNTTGDILLAHNTTYRRGELATLTLPAITPAETYHSGVQFTSGATPTAVTDSSGAYWQGADVVVIDSVNVFQPTANKRYGIYFEYDGTILKAFSEAVSL